MTRRSLKPTAIALVSSFALATGSLAAKAPAKIELGADSEMGAVVIKTEWWQPAPSMQSAFKLLLSGYDPVQQKLASGSALIEAKKSNFAEGYLVVPVKAGRWVIQSYSQQDEWALCFNGGTRQFEVKPGEVVYLGELDAAAHRSELEEQATSTGKLFVSGYGFADFFDLPDGPHLGAIDDAQLAELRAVLARTAPKITAPVRAAEFTPAIFGTGSTLLGERRCGGYFVEGAKKKR